MNTEKMNVHKALAELKILDGKIIKKIATSDFCVANKHSNDKIKGLLIADFEKNAIQDYQAITDLINRRKAIKRALTLSNAITTVTVDGVAYTIAEAIEMKNHGIDLEAKLYSKISDQYATAKYVCEDENKTLQQRAEKFATGLFESKDKALSKDIDDQIEFFKKQNVYEVIDPIGCKATIDKLSDKIDSFLSEIDSAISTSNAITELTIEY